MAEAETRQGACTVAVTLNEAVAVAATAGLEARPDASKPNVKTDNADFIDVPLSFSEKTHSEKNHDGILIVASRQNFSARRKSVFDHEPQTRRGIERQLGMGGLP